MLCLPLGSHGSMTTAGSMEDSSRGRDGGRDGGG